MGWLRIKRPVKCVCGRSDWCMVSDKGDSFLCMRVQSSRLFTLKDGTPGWIHGINGELPKIHKEVRIKAETIDAGAMLEKARKTTTADQINRLSVQLGVRASSLLELGVAFGNWTEWKDRKRRDYSAWWFPMRDGNGRVVGLRARDWNGSKWTVTGSIGGVFHPYCEPDKTVWLPEGATDCAALRSLNLFSIGRPSNTGGAMVIKQIVERLGIRQAVILGDTEPDKVTPDGRGFNPGYDGAESLSRQLTIPHCVLYLPCKDIREAMKRGVTANVLEGLVKDTVWRNPTI